MMFDDTINELEFPKFSERSDKPREKRCKVSLRSEWGAQPAESWTLLALPVKHIVLSRTDTEPCSTEDECKSRVQQIQRAHLEEGAPDIKHNFLVGGDGVLYFGRGYIRVGPRYPRSPKRIERLNGLSIDIGFIGYEFSESSDIMQKAAADCIAMGTTGGLIYKQYDVHWIANNEIQHEETMGEIE